MQLKYVSIIIALLIPIITTAQSGYGIRAGLNFADYNPNYEIDSMGTEEAATKHLGSQAGVFYTISGGGLFSMQPEFNFSQKGIRYTDAGNLLAKRTLNYLGFNFLGQTRIINSESVKTYIQLGPGVSYLVSGNDRVQTGNGILKEKIDFDAANLQRLDLSIHAAFGAAFRIGFENALFIEARYSLGLSDLNDIPEGQQPDGYESVNNRVLSVCIGYIYYLDGFSD